MIILAILEKIITVCNVVLDPEQLLWVFILGCITAFIVAYGIGANDVANSFGTSVGSGAISMRTALVMAAVMEWLGAVTLGQTVTETIRGGISNQNCYANFESELMLGMTCALFATGIWLLLASYNGLPVSTTHSTVGAIIGFSVASKGYECVYWDWHDGKGLLAIATSWVVSPVASGVLGALIYFFIVVFIIKAPDPLRRGFESIPFIFAVNVAIVIGLIFFKSPTTKNVPDTVSWMVVLGSTLVAIIFGIFVGIPLLKKFMVIREKWLSKSKKEDSNVRLSESDMLVPKRGEETEVNERFHKEKEIDKLFVFFQVMSAAFESFAHGANDVANAVGPFVTIWFIWSEGEPATKVDTPIWVLAAGGAGIVLGLATFGKRVMDTIGKDITHVNFTRGFSIEISSCLSVVIASRLGYPISTTHCQVGSVVAVGLMNMLLHRTRWAPAEPLDNLGISWKLFLNVGISWLVTVPTTALIAAGLFGVLNPTILKESIYHTNSSLPCQF